MEDLIFETAMKAVSDADTKDPFIIAEHLKIIPIPINGSILGYAALYNGKIPVIGLNTRLDPVWYTFGGWHEIAHVLYEDIYSENLPAGGVVDTSFGMHEVDSKTIAVHERRANLLAADICLSDEDVADVTRYNSPLMRDYRLLVTHQEELVRAYDQLTFSVQRADPSPMMKVRLKSYQNSLRKLNEQKNEMESEMMSMNCCKTFSEMASELNTTETILRYKLEAMRLRGEDIAPQNLEHYAKVFKGAL